MPFFLCLFPPLPSLLLHTESLAAAAGLSGGKKTPTNPTQTRAMLYFMLTAAFDLKMMSHWVSWSAYYSVMDGCQSGGGWQIAMGGGEQMPGDFRGFSGARD